MKKKVLISLLVGATCFSSAQTYTITTIAGNGTSGFSGDGGAATAAKLFYPVGVAVDASGNIYIADEVNNRIRKVNTIGIISTIAGNGTQGFSGDGGAATLASLNQPSGVAVDASGNVYIADQNNNRIRKVNTSGIISTLAGNGTQGFSGDGGTATSAELYYPHYVVVDASGNVYFGEWNNSRIREVNTGGIINTIAGNGTGGFSGDGGAAIAAELNYPAGVVVDAPGNVYFADNGNYRIRKLTPSSTSTGIQNLNTKSGFILYPNPCNGDVNISSSFTDGGFIEITNNLGQILLTSKFTGGSTSFHIESAPGMYFYRVKAGDNIVSEGKIIIN